MSPTVDDTIFAICNTYNTILKSIPRAAIFSRDMSFNIPYVSNWNEVGRPRQESRTGEMHQ